MVMAVGGKKRRWLLFISLIVCGIVVAVCSVILMPMLYTAIIDRVVRNMMVLNPSSAIFQDWVTPPLPLYSSFYIFHVENPDAILEGHKPVLTEKGPYVYRVEVPRDNVTLHCNGTISSTQVYTYVYEPSMSVGPETDEFTMVNPIAVATTIHAKDLSLFVKKKLSEQMERLNETVFMNRSVAEILWGYEDNFIKLANQFITIPGWDTDLFGILWGRNNSGLGVYTVYDGSEDQSILNMFERYNGNTELSWWYSPQANMLNGTDGTMYHPFLDREETIQLFHPDLCRSVSMLYEQDITFKGVPLFKFVLANYTYANGTVYPPNEGFYKSGTSVPSGILRQDPCRLGQPLGLSNPHFYEADPILIDSVEGMNPVREKHESFLALEERMGLPYIFKLRLQVNSLMEPVDGISQVEDVPNVYFPLVWFELAVTADDYIISLYDKGFVMTEKILDSVQWILFSIGIILTLCSAYWCLKWWRNSQTEKGKSQDCTDDVEIDEKFTQKGEKKDADSYHYKNNGYDYDGDTKRKQDDSSS
ncbi:Scavenger receptor class B member 1 [Holothuria leucospilota]|uniref:Scavenger receptor class B member 1 n=1 Tax=Holothuria leucospilota TaxID=206669 RepID=A0A9Q1CJN6_HOLLE|nr:Scavenger receptor class B member 1 [Holothuria leucospilota]